MRRELERLVGLQSAAGVVCRLPGLLAEALTGRGEEAVVQPVSDRGIVPVETGGVGGAAEPGSELVLAVGGRDRREPIERFELQPLEGDLPC